MEMPAKQAPTASSEIVMLIRKLRWVGLEEKAEQLEKELEQHAVADTVVSIQNETSAKKDSIRASVMGITVRPDPEYIPSLCSLHHQSVANLYATGLVRRNG